RTNGPPWHHESINVTRRPPLRLMTRLTAPSFADVHEQTSSSPGFSPVQWASTATGCVPESSDLPPSQLVPCQPVPHVRRLWQRASCSPHRLLARSRLVPAAPESHRALALDDEVARPP